MHLGHLVKRLKARNQGKSKGNVPFYWVPFIDGWQRIGINPIH
jgi:hypothetical protein